MPVTFFQSWPDALKKMIFSLHCHATKNAVLKAFKASGGLCAVNHARAWQTERTRVHAAHRVGPLEIADIRIGWRKHLLLAVPCVGPQFKSSHGSL